MINTMPDKYLEAKGNGIEAVWKINGTIAVFNKINSDAGFLF